MMELMLQADIHVFSGIIPNVDLLYLHIEEVL
jgi:hypothetical protein